MADPATTAAQGEVVQLLEAEDRTQNQEEIWGNQLMIRMIMINKLIMITVPSDQVLVFIKTLTKENQTTELTKMVVLLEAPIVRNFTIKNNEIYPKALREF